MSKEQEDLREKFEEETNQALWAEDINEDVGFSDKYVEWLEKQLLLYNVVDSEAKLPWWEEQIKSLEDLQRELRQQIRDSQ